MDEIPIINSLLRFFPCLNKSVLALDVLILIALLMGIGALGTLAVTGVRVAPSVRVGQLNSYFSGVNGSIAIPVSIRNPGPLSLDAISVTAIVFDSNGSAMFHGGGGPLSIPPGSSKELTIDVPFDVANLPSATLESLLTTNQNFSVWASLAGSVPHLVGLNATVQTTIPWGAPLSNLEMGLAQVAPYNSTYLQLAVPISFENNNNYVDISTDLNILIMNDSYILGGGTMLINAPHGAAFSHSIVAYVALDSLPMNKLLFNDSTSLTTVTCGSLSSASFSTSQNVSIGWKAPMHGLSIGSLVTTAYNSTYSAFTLPFSFIDSSPYFDVNATVDGFVVGSSGARVGSVQNYGIHANAGTSYTGDLSGYIYGSSLSQTPYTLILLFHTAYGTFEKDIIVNG